MRRLLIIPLLIIGCTRQPVTPAEGHAVAQSESKPERLHVQHLPNAIRIHPQVISGGLPEDDAAFRELADLGVKTVISVDGARPDVAMAKKHGLRYVHLPHGYDGIPEGRANELAKAVLELDGPIYIHCHHGKHRSPAAASVACVRAGLIPQTSAIPFLEFAGTSPDYRGLYQSADRAHPEDQALLRSLRVEFPETVNVPPLAQAMVNLEHTHDHLKQIAAAGWKSPADHPDLSPVHEALLLQEHFTELLRTEEVQQQSADFQQSLRDSEAAAKSLLAALKAWQEDAESGDPPPRLSELMSTIGTQCKTCHKQHRDQPLFGSN